MTRRRLAVLLVWTLPSLVFLAATAIVYTAYRIPPPDRIGDADRAAVMAPLRAALEGAPGAPCTVKRSIAGMVGVTVWHKGRSIARFDGQSDDLAAAVDSAAQQMRASPAIAAIKAEDRPSARIQVDIVTGTGPLGEGNWLFDRLQVPGVGDMLAINSGVEGIGATIDGKTAAALLPHELVIGKMLAAKKPSAALQDFAMGVDLARIRTTLQARAKVAALEPDQLFRFRTDTFVEQHVSERAKPPLQLYRGIPEAPKISAATLREAALAGGKFLVKHMAENGRYIYEHDVGTGMKTDPKATVGPASAYSMPRHAGTTYFLAELYRITKAPFLKQPIQNAFRHLADLMRNGKCTGKLPDGTDIDCVMDRNDRIATLGSTALAVVALAEYQRATGSTEYLPMATKFSSWILWMQREDGSFRHRYDPVSKRADDEAQDLYYSGEAALALARMWTVTHDTRYALAANAALHWLVDWYDFFMGGFFYGEEHWTCIASEAAFEFAPIPKFRDFCHGYGAFLRNQQTELGDHPDQDDWTGAYSFTPFLAPHNTPAGSRTEAMISSYLLGRHHGTPDADVRRQVVAAMQYTLGQQIRANNDFNSIGDDVEGGMPSSPIDRNIRIDYVQHVCSAMIRASEFIDQPE
jgi:hypothetical protein